MKKNNILRKTVTAICLMLMLVWAASGCANTAGFVSQAGGTDEVPAASENSGQETLQDADPQETETEPVPAEEPTVDIAQPSDGPSDDVEEIPITEIGEIAIGQTENAEAGTGCTVFISKDGMAAGLDVRGGGPASRESELLDPLAAASEIHAILLSGGSAYGLGAADGVMKYLEEKDIGYDTGVAKVPLVAQSDLFDLSVGDGSVRPDADMGYEAARIAMESPNYKDGNYGAGCGATVGKIAGMTHDGYARSIRPVHTTADGDSIYAVSVGDVEADQDLVGSLSAVVMSEAIKRAVYSAESAYGFKSAKDLDN